MTHPLTRSAALLTALLALVLVGGAALAYPVLPAMVPAHFDAAGRPDRLVPTGPLSWFLPALVGVLTAAGLWLVVVLLPSRPHLLNLPDAERLRALDAEGQRAVAIRAQPALATLAPGLLLIFLAVQLAMWEGAHGRSTGWLAPVVLVLPLVSLVAMFSLLQGAQDELDRRARQAARR